MDEEVPQALGNHIREGDRPVLDSLNDNGRHPRTTRLKVLAIHLDGLVRIRQIKNHVAISQVPAFHRS